MATRVINRLFLTAAITLVGINGAAPALATVSGNNGLIAFTTNRDGNREIYTMSADGSNPTNLTKAPGADDYDPAWSPDARRIAFASDRAGNPDVYVMDQDGANLIRLTTDAGDDWEPTWSPDGRQIAFAGEDGIYSIDASGGNVRRITDPQAFLPPVGVTHVSDGHPAWSPDGTRIAFLRTYQGPVARDGHYDDLMILDVSSSRPANTLLSNSWFDTPNWSPDGSNLVVVEKERVDINAVQYRTVLVDAENGDRTVILGLNWSDAIDWSPDGSAFIGSNGDIHVINLDGSDLANLTNHPAHDTEPSWQPLNPYPVGMFDPATGIWHLRDRTARVESFYYGNPGDEPFFGDWDCDGTDTPGLYRRSDGFVYLRNSNTQGVADIAFYFGDPGDIPLPGDFDGDGCDTLSLYRPSEQVFYIIDSLGSDDEGLGSADYSFMFGNPGDEPFTGDFDGDGVDEVALHRRTTGRVYLRQTLTTGPADLDFVFGDPGDMVFAGDWNADGTDTPALFRPANRTFYFRFSNTTGVADAHYIFGNPGWLPAPGDFGLD